MFECSLFPENPKVGSCVVSKITKVNKEYIEVELIEYNNIKAIINLRELSKRRVKNISHVTKVGRVEITKVIQVDGNNIDLSLKRVTPEDKDRTTGIYKKNRIAYQVVFKASKNLKIPVGEIYKRKCYEEIKNHYTLFKYFVHLKNTPEDVDSSDIYEKEFYNIISKEYKPQSYKFRADVGLTCSRKDGLFHIKHALDKAKEYDNGLSITLINSPIYLISQTYLSEQDGFLQFEKILNIIRSSIEGDGGSYELLSTPHVFGEKSKRTILNDDSSEVESEDFE